MIHSDSIHIGQLKVTHGNDYALWDYELKPMARPKPDMHTITTAIYMGDDGLGYATLTVAGKNKKLERAVVYTYRGRLKKAALHLIQHTEGHPLFLPDPLATTPTKHNVVHGSARFSSRSHTRLARALKNNPENYIQWLDQQDEAEGGWKYWIERAPTPEQTDFLMYKVWQRKNPTKRIYQPLQWTALSRLEDPPFPTEDLFGYPSVTGITAGRYAYIMGLLLLLRSGHLQEKPNYFDRLDKLEDAKK